MQMGGTKPPVFANLDMVCLFFVGNGTGNVGIGAL